MTHVLCRRQHAGVGVLQMTTAGTAIADMCFSLLSALHAFAERVQLLLHI